MSAAFRLTGTAVYGVNLLNAFAALLLVERAGDLAALEVPQAHALALFFLDVHWHGCDLGLVFVGVHCLVLGLLLHASGYVPRVLGVLGAVAGGE
jgi:hypothetical protein